MDILGYLILLAVFAVPMLIGFATVWCLRARLRIWVVSLELIVPISMIAFYLSPLPFILGLTRDPGYDSEAIRMAVLYVMSLAFLLMVSIGMVLAALIRYVRRYPMKRS